MKKTILFFLYVRLFADPGEVLDIETLPYLRTEQYSMRPYEKIVVFSAPRTGSSLVYNVFRFLFEKSQYLSLPHNEFRLDRATLKTHKLPEIEILKQGKENILYVVTIRNPLEASISTYRIRPRPVEKIQLFCKQLIERQAKYVNFIENLKDAGYPVAIIRYEDFERDQCRYLLEFIQTRFQITVSEIDARILETGYSRENIYSNIQSIPDFSGVLPVSGFHGKHVSLTPFTPPENLLTWLNHYLEEIKPLFRKYGYFNE